MGRVFILFYFIFLSSIYARPFDITSKVTDLLPYSEVYIDYERTKTVTDIQKSTVQFKENNSSRLSYGYSPNFDVWLKIVFFNDSNKEIKKVIEYENPLTTKIEFYDISNNKKYTKGLFFIDKGRTTLNPTFEVSLKPFEQKVYYIKATSTITTLIVKLNLLDEKSFFKNELSKQIVLALFFGAMFILALYNFSIFIITKDISYFYYVLYIIGIIAHHLVYVGFASLYLLDQNQIFGVISYASVLVSFPIIALAFFTKTFLHTSQYPKLNFGLIILLLLVVVSIIACSVTSDFNRFRNLVPMLLFIYLLIITIYASYKNNKQAYFILFGWTVIVLAAILMFLSGIGIYDFNEHFKYIVELSFLLEAIIFSIALASKINRLQYEKNEANKALIIHQRNQKEELSKEVKIKTIKLEGMVKEKDLLLKEINHRVKNNLQLIISLLRLQNDTLEESETKNIINTIQNRINAISHVHELLYKQEDISHINASEYLMNLIIEIQETYSRAINIIFDVNASLKVEDGVYCGLIINEIVTNAFKYAFPSGSGEIKIDLIEGDAEYFLTIADNGIGLPSDMKPSVGSLLIETLVINQLQGKLEIDSSNGVTTKIQWKK